MVKWNFLFSVKLKWWPLITQIENAIIWLIYKQFKINLFDSSEELQFSQTRACSTLTIAKLKLKLKSETITEIQASI